jgi:hypothetical protein
MQSHPCDVTESDPQPHVYFDDQLLDDQLLVIMTLYSRTIGASYDYSEWEKELVSEQSP